MRGALQRQRAPFLRLPSPSRGGEPQKIFIVFYAKPC